MKIGLLLGTFDPVSIAHVSLCAKTINEGLVDKVYVVPTVQNPWKTEKPKATFEERCAMITKAIQPINDVYDGSVTCLGIEGELFPPYYTCNTLERIMKMFPNDELYIIAGADVINTVRGWLKYEEIIKPNFKFIGFTRGDIEINNQDIQYTLVQSDIPDVSSTIIRELLSDGKCAYPLICMDIANDCKEIYTGENYII